jgi:hypothetical protein
VNSQPVTVKWILFCPIRCWSRWCDKVSFKFAVCSCNKFELSSLHYQQNWIYLRVLSKDNWTTKVLADSFHSHCTELAKDGHARWIEENQRDLLDPVTYLPWVSQALYRPSKAWICEMNWEKRKRPTGSYYMNLGADWWSRSKRKEEGENRTMYFSNNIEEKAAYLCN